MYLLLFVGSFVSEENIQLGTMDSLFEEKLDEMIKLLLFLAYYLFLYMNHPKQYDLQQ